MNETLFGIINLKKRILSKEKDIKEKVSSLKNLKYINVKR